MDIHRTRLIIQKNQSSLYRATTKNQRGLYNVSRIFIVGFLLTFLVAFPGMASNGGIEDLRETSKAFASVAKSVSPSVVFIQTETTAQTKDLSGFDFPFGETFPFDDDFFKRFFGEPYGGSSPRKNVPPARQRNVAQGSGFVIKSSHKLLTDVTYIMTNNHVVQGAETIRVRMNDGLEFDARITGTDPLSDVAVIAVKASNLQPVKPADSSKLEPGEWVIAIGNPFGLSHTITVGVVSATGRTSVGINNYEDFIQTDAAINPGNSGGPLVNLDGEVVGMNTAIFSRSGGYMGIGFAIPINMAMDIANQLIDTGEVTRGYIGITIQALTPELAESLNIKDKQGILVANVAEDSPAARAKLQTGDVIVSYRDKPVTNVGDFRNQVSLTPPGKKVSLELIRNGRPQTISVTIGKLTADNTQAIVGEEGEEGGTELGLTVQTLTADLAQQFSAHAGEGVVVTQVTPGSIAALAGIANGNIILEVNRQKISKADEFKRAIKQASKDQRVLLLVRQGDTQRFVALSW